MATSMWRMNELCRKMTGLLVLCTLLLSSIVLCQTPVDDSTAATITAALPSASVAPTVVSTLNRGLTSFTSTTDNSTSNATVGNAAEIEALDAIAPGSSNNVKATKCGSAGSSEDCVSTESTQSSSSSDSSVFVGILVTGLLAALGITTGYFYCQRRSDTKGMKLTDETYPADQENQGNTLVSVAPLNPPPETQEKPSVNGESPEAPKTQPPPPTNGHSTTKTSDTEL